MTKSLGKNIARSIRGSLGRYIAIMLIITLGVSFFVGLRATRPAMIAVAERYFDDTSLYDLRLLSTLGFDGDDRQAALECDHIIAAEGSINQDFLWIYEGGENVLRAHMLTEEINVPHLTAGRLPRNGDECLVDGLWFGEEMIGQTILVSDTNDTDTLDAFAYREYTVVGLADSPLYLDIARGTSSIGNGSITAFVLIPEEGFALEVYTELYLKTDEEFELYSEEYDALIDGVTGSVEDAIILSLDARFDDYISEGWAEIHQAEQELAEEKAKAEADLEDARRKLEQAYEELIQGEAELKDAWAQLQDAKAQLDDGAAQIKSSYTSWEDALNYGWAQYNDGVKQLETGLADGEAQLDQSKQQLEELEETWQSGQTELDAGWAEFNGYMDQWQAGYNEYAAGKAEYDAGIAAYNQGVADYKAAKAELADNRGSMTTMQYLTKLAELELQRITLESTKLLLDANKPQLDEAKAELDAAYEELMASKAPLDEAQAQLDELRTALDEGWAQYHEGVAELERQRTEQSATLAEAKSSLEAFEAGIADYYTGLDACNDGRAALDEGWEEYDKGMQEYRDGLTEFETTISDAEEDIAEAKEDLSELEGPELYTLQRSESHAGYTTFENDSQIVQNIASVFPVFFFLIAALVCSTTMTRMVDEDRTQIGTMRALGYSRGSILAKYIIYSASAATIGTLIGYFGGSYLFPLVIWTAYQMLYNMPGYVCVLDPVMFILSLGAALLCSAGTAYFACRREMRSTPADLIRPKTPSAGKRILLEGITPFWKRLKFLHKVTLRNIFRFKKRMFMMLLGIAGCTALVLTGFGVNNSIANIANYQYDDIQRYDISVSFEEVVPGHQLNKLMQEYSGDTEARALAQMFSGDITGTKATKSVYFVASDDLYITDIFHLHLGESTVPFPKDDELLISEKLAALAGIQIGDTVTISLSDTETAQIKVVGLVENYVMNYAYMTGATYDKLFNEGFEPTTLLLRVHEDADEYAVAASLANEHDVANVSVVSDTRKMISNMMESLDYVVALILVCAGALAFIVLFNLGNINITERVREIATIKVLGFHVGETGAYVFRENVILSLMGIAVGLPLGVVLHSFVMSRLTVDMVSFKVVIAPFSFLYTVVMVFGFTVITDLALRRKIAKINMAESLKSIE